MLPTGALRYDKILQDGRVGAFQKQRGFDIFKPGVSGRISGSGRFIQYQRREQNQIPEGYD